MKNNQLSLAFFGSSENSVLVLNELWENFKIKLVITAPPRATGRKKTVTPTHIHRYSLEKKLPLSTPEKLNRKFIQDFIQHKFDLAIVADYRNLIPEKILHQPQLGFINLHPSLLPRYRGSTPVQSAILRGDRTTGLTFIQINAKFDQGPILAFFKEKIKPYDTAPTLYRRLFSLGAELLITVISLWKANKIIPSSQTALLASPAPRLTREDGFIPYPKLLLALQGKELDPQTRPRRMLLARGSWPQIVERAVRALSPWPGVWTVIPTAKGEKRVKILKSQIRNRRLILTQTQLEGKSLVSGNLITGLISS